MEVIKCRVEQHSNVTLLLMQAKTVSLSGQAKIKLTVDIQAGKLMAIKPTKSILNDNNVFSHDKSMILLFGT